MAFRSIRLRLAASFAAIALIAAIVIGVVLLAILRNYYRDQELDYLRGNAQTVGKVLTGIMQAQVPPDELQAQVKSLAFLSQTRIQIYDAAGRLLGDSGAPKQLNVDLGIMKQQFAVQEKSGPSGDIVFFSVGGSQAEPPALSVDTKPGALIGKTETGPIPEPGQKLVFVYRSVRAGDSPFGFQLKTGPDPAAFEPRSTLRMAEIVRDPDSGSRLGTITLSEGPAYGSAILHSVAQGWALASLIGILLAAAVGWYISRRISAPVLALAGVTARMAAGDLTSRAEAHSHDEFGQLSRSFNEMADQVETTVGTLRRFVADAAHELRTPLTALRTNIDLALDDRHADERAALLARAQALVQRLEELNSNLLDLSRLEANGHAAEKADVDLRALLQERVESYASQAEQAGLAFEWDAPSQPLIVHGDKAQLGRAMSNLVDNACKFTPPDGTVRVRLARQEADAVFSVSDTGIGIPADDLPQIFSRFHRGRNANSYPGSGLGLAIVKAIVTMHSGAVEAQSEGAGRGSLLSFRLPLVAGS